jgi:glycosyltransferase involved in cell wall biosynthesis
VRALFVCPDMRTGGAERHWATLVPALRERGLDARVLCLSEEGALFGDLVAAGVPASCARMRRRRDLRGLMRAFELAQPAPDVVVTRGVSAQVVGEAIARRARAPHVMNEHTPLTADGRMLAPRAHQTALIRLAAPLVAGVIAVTRRQVEPLVRLGYRRDRIEVVPNGVFADRIQPTIARDEVRAALGVAPDERLALCVSRLQPEKRVDVFVAAAAAARREQPTLRAFVAGDGEERPRIGRLANGSGVALLGVRHDVPDLIAAADMLCLPSDSEALPMSILEAMALARPVVATDVGGTPEQVEHERTGLLVAPGDVAGVAAALARLSADPAAARAMGERGRERQRERFDGDAMVARYARALEAAARRERPPRPGGTR